MTANSRSYGPGELRLAIMGDVLRHPGTSMRAVAERLEVADRNVVRVVLNRLVERELVRPIAEGFVLGRSGIEHLAQIRRMVSV